MKLKKATKAILLCSAFALTASMPMVSMSQSTNTNADLNETAGQYSAEINLAYIAPPSEDLKRTTQRGMESLLFELTKRTTVEPKTVKALDIETDELSFYPFIYWPVTNDTAMLSEAAQEKVQNYIDSGGIILFDTLGKTRADVLRNILGNVKIKPLTQIDEEHTLTKTFYLSANLPGTYNTEPVWIEIDDNQDNETVSSVIIGNNDWASAWAKKSNNEVWNRSIQSGINMVMYALSGHYKSDQLHIPAILERLEKK
jgi:hypothetical protein